jgi:hypothetical protein
MYDDVMKRQHEKYFSLCNRSYVWPADLKRHLKTKHDQQKSTLKQPYIPVQQQRPYIPEQQQRQHEIQWKTEEPFWIIPTKDPDTFVCADGPDPNHFMPWIHPFTSVIFPFFILYLIVMLNS